MPEFWCRNWGKPRFHRRERLPEGHSYAAFSNRQRFTQSADFFVDFRRIRDCTRDLLAQENNVLLAKPVDRSFGRANPHAERFGHLFIRWWRPSKLDPNERVQDFKPSRFFGYGTFFL